MNKDTADLLFETLDALNKHTGRLDKLDRKSSNQVKELESAVSILEKQIEVSCKDVLLQLIEKGAVDKEQLVRDITTTVATSIAKLSIKAGDITVNVETDSIAKVIGKLPLNNTNNITIDTAEFTKHNKQFLTSFESINTNLVNNLTALKVIFQELAKREKVEQPIPAQAVKEESSEITGMLVKRDKDGMINSIEFTR